MSMKSKRADADAALQREAMMRNESAIKLQQHARVFVIRRRLRHLYSLEDKVLVKPKPGGTALKQLLPPAVEVPISRPSSGASGAKRQGSKGSHDPVSDPRGLQETKKVQPPLSLQVLASHLQKTNTYSSRKVQHMSVHMQVMNAAQAIFRLLSVPLDGSLQKGHLDRIYQHHRIHRRIALSSTRLRLVVMRHGESSWAFAQGDRPATTPALSPMVNHERCLQPAGWNQVTRASWALRLCPDWKPQMLLSSSLQCCRQTSERVCSVLDDPDLRTSSVPRDPIPISFTCPTLDYPDHQGLGFPVWDLGGDVHEAVSQLEIDTASPATQKDLDALSRRPPKTLMLVTTGAAIQTMLGFLATGTSREHLDQLLVGSGDALLLESPVLHRVCESSLRERVRPDCELWKAALSRNQWKVIRHIRGDGLDTKLGCLPKPVKELNAEVRARIVRKVKRPKFYETFHVPEADEKGREVYSDTRVRFRNYAGEPMIFSHTEFSKLCRQAGRAELPLESEFCVKVKPLVFGFKFKPEVSSSGPGLEPA